MMSPRGNYRNQPDGGSSSPVDNEPGAPLFSVVIPAYNRESLISATLDSVLRQEFTDFEVIVVDDGSSDRTREVIARFGERIQLLRQENQGPGIARNLGVAQARGRYVAFLDSDDLWFPWTLAVYERLIREHGEPALIGGCLLPFSIERELDGARRLPAQCQLFDDYLASSRHNSCVPTCKAVVRREVLLKVAGFNPRNINAEDHDLMLRIGVAPGFVHVESPPTVAYRKHTQNVSGDLVKNYQGVRLLLEQERAGAYPGGKARETERLRIITRHVRPISINCCGMGEFRKGWELYRGTFRWHLQLRRWRYLAGLPLRAIECAIAGSRAAAGR